MQGVINFFISALKLCFHIPHVILFFKIMSSYHIAFIINLIFVLYEIKKIIVVTQPGASIARVTASALALYVIMKNIKLFRYLIVFAIILIGFSMYKFFRFDAMSCNRNCDSFVNWNFIIIERFKFNLTMQCYLMSLSCVVIILRFLI